MYKTVGAAIAEITANLEALRPFADLTLYKEVEPETTTPPTLVLGRRYIRRDGKPFSFGLGKPARRRDSKPPGHH